MTRRKTPNVALSLFLIFSFVAASLPARAQTVEQTTPNEDLAPKLAAIEARLEKRRAELGIPGASLVIVKDDRIVYLKGLGYKDFERKIPVTPDTQFAIGSATKAFTGLSVMMTQDEGKMNLDDSPKKYLPYFRINDPAIDARITIRDLLSHSSGLNRTDLPMMTGKLNREEIIRVAGEAKPTAGLRERFQYQNVMYAAAGESVARVQKMPWERFVAERILKPLGMTNSNLTVKEMQRAKDYSFGYEYNADTKETIKKPTRDLAEISPAGAINSSARDMSEWLRFMLGGGAVNGKRLVSEASFAELTKPQMKIAGNVSYGLGWFVRQWNGMKTVDHGGNIDGFNALVAMIPEKKLGFVLLTNVSGSPLPNEMMPFIWSTLLGAQPQPAAKTAAAVKPETEVGKFRFAEANFDLEVVMRDGKLVALVPNQPEYPLENVGGRRYKLNGAPDGFFITFREADAYLEQPQGNFALPRVKSDAAGSAALSAALKEIVGKYEDEKNPARGIEIAERDGKVSLVVAGQPPYELREKSKDVFASSALPDSYSVKARRDASGKLTGIALVQPEGEFGFNRAGATAPAMPVEDLMAKVVEALGGEANWRRQTTRVATFDIDFVHQGVKGSGTQYAKAPNLTASVSVMTALGKRIAESQDYFDGREGGQWISFSDFEKVTGKSLEDMRISADFYGLVNWRTLYKTAIVKGTAKTGGEDAFVVVFEPEKGNRDTIYFSAKTFLPLKLESVNTSSTSGTELPFSETYSDYRPVDGIMLPFKTVNTNLSFGDIVTTLKEVKHGAPVPDKIFQPRRK